MQHLFRETHVCASRAIVCAKKGVHKAFCAKSALVYNICATAAQPCKFWLHKTLCNQNSVQIPSVIRVDSVPTLLSQK